MNITVKKLKKVVLENISRGAGQKNMRGQRGTLPVVGL